MPVVTVFGIPARLRNTPALLEFVKQGLPNAAASIPEMKIKPGLVTVFVPADLLDQDPGREIIVFVEGLFMREERTSEVRQRFADAIRDCVVSFVQDHVPECEMIEVIPRSQRPDDGFSDWRKSA